MIGWLVGLGWALGAVLTFRPVFRGLMGGLAPAYRPGWDEVVFCMAMAASIVGLFWPAVVWYFALRATVGRKDPARFARAVGGESAGCRAERLERERGERERYIDRLERELGLGPYAEVPE